MGELYKINSTVSTIRYAKIIVFLVRSSCTLPFQRIFKSFFFTSHNVSVNGLKDFVRSNLGPFSSYIHAYKCIENEALCW